MLMKLFICCMAGGEFIMITLGTEKIFLKLFVPIFIGFSHILLFVNTPLVLN